MQKKFLGFIVLIIISAGLIGCSIMGKNKADAEDISTDKEMEAVGNIEKINQKLIDDDNVAITITEKYEVGDRIYKEIGYTVEIVNKRTDVDLQVGISDVTVNGKKNNPLWSTVVSAGSKSNENITWWFGNKSDKYNPNVKTLEDLKNVKGTVVVSNGKTSANIGKYKINIK